MTARYLIGDVFDGLRSLDDDSVDLIISSPPFLALRSYLPAGDPNKLKEIGSEQTPADYLDVLLDVVQECRRVLAPHGSLVFELGDTYAGSGGGGGDYLPGGLRENQPGFEGSASASRLRHREDCDLDLDCSCGAMVREANAAHWRMKNEQRDAWPLSKSLCGIPTLFAWSLAYGRNLLRPERTVDPWRIRNLIAWVRPNPPVGALGDKFRPATSYLTVACVGPRRWFDLDAVREPHKTADALTRPRAIYDTDQRADGGDRTNGRGNTSDPAGAPPLDWWEIPTEPSNGEGTFHRVHVPSDAVADGIRRTTSPDCPLHGSPDHPGPNAPDDEHATDSLNRTERTESRPEATREADSAPTLWSTDPTDSSGSPLGHAATPHSMASSRTVPGPATTSPDTPSARTAADTGRSPTPPVSSAPHPDMPASNISEACPPAAGHGTEPRSSRTGSPEPACTCSHYIDILLPDTEDSSHYAGWPADYWEIPTEGFKGSHYATWPRRLLDRPILAMCPRRVCTVCGQPSERITGDTTYVNARTGTEVSKERWPDPELLRQGAIGHDNGALRVAETVGWSDCGHGTWRAGTVLDPFAGSGTTLAVAVAHGRQAIGIDIDPRNADLAHDRVGMWLTVETIGRHGPRATIDTSPNDVFL